MRIKTKSRAAGSWRTSPLRKRWIFYTFLITVLLYLGSYGLMARSGILAPGHCTYPKGSKKRFVLRQQKPFTLVNLLTRKPIIVPFDAVFLKSDSVFEPVHLSRGRDTRLTTVYLPAGYVHQWLDRKGWWPDALQGKVSVSFADHKILPSEINPLRPSLNLHSRVQQKRIQTKKRWGKDPDFQKQNRSMVQQENP
jgi:hypothetical protein